MHQRLADAVDDGTIEVGLRALDHKLDLLTLNAREIVHEARKAFEDAADRNHAHLHHRLLQDVGGAREAGRTLAELPDQRHGFGREQLVS